MNAQVEKYNVVSFSGGRTSAYLIHRIQTMVSQGLIKNVKYVFMDTGAEHPKTYEFIRQVVKHFEIDLVCIRSVMTTEVGVGAKFKEISIDDICDDYGPWKDMMKCYSTPFIHGPMCTDLMKTAPYKKYCDETFGRHNYTSWLGIRIDEPRRLKPKKGYRFLAEISPMDKQDILGFWKTQPFDLDLDEWLGNCVFCIKKGVNKIALAAIDEPELAAKFWDMLNTQPIRIIETRVDAPLIMYRGNNTFKSAQDSFADFGRDDILSRMRGNNGGCAESCEVFGCQGDLFEEQKVEKSA